MSKKPSSLLPCLTGSCPSQQCSSHACVFKNLQKHILLKPECIQYMHMLHKTLGTTLGPLDFEETLQHNKWVFVPAHTSTNHLIAPMEEEDSGWV
jgi:hypothetical protein